MILSFMVLVIGSRDKIHYFKATSSNDKDRNYSPQVKYAPFLWLRFQIVLGLLLLDPPKRLVLIGGSRISPANFVISNDGEALFHLMRENWFLENSTRK